MPAMAPFDPCRLASAMSLGRCFTQGPARVESGVWRGIRTDAKETRVSHLGRLHLFGGVQSLAPVRSP